MNTNNIGLPRCLTGIFELHSGYSLRFIKRYIAMRDLNEEDISGVRDAVIRKVSDNVRFSYITLLETKKEGPRRAEVLFSVKGKASKAVVSLESKCVERVQALPENCQPMFSPDDCNLAEKIVMQDPEVQKMLAERYGIALEDIDTQLVCDPWSVHSPTADFELLHWRKTQGEEEPGVAARLVQTFLYWRSTAVDNQYAHPIDLLPVVDLIAEKVVHIGHQPGVTPPTMNKSSFVNYHRDSIAANTYLPSKFRPCMPPLDVVQPEGPAFCVEENENGRFVSWDKWTLRLGFNYREGLVLHDVKFDGRSILNRASLVEMAVPYGDPNPPYERKCAFDVGDYGLGYCTNSLELGCDCLGHIRYFDVTLADSAGNPYVVKKAICLHEEDDGLLWKHVEFRTGHSEARRSRRLVISFIATVVNYEYLFYWYFLQDGTIEYEIKLSGMLSTNMLSASESEYGQPKHGTLVAPGVNAQVHQHMFCARLDFAVDGQVNSVEEVDLVSGGSGPNPFGNLMGPVKTPLTSEKQAARVADSTRARSWRITNLDSLHPVTKQPVAYKLVPFTRGPAQPTLLTGPKSTVTKKGVFATKNIWVTHHNDEQMWPAGEFTVQGELGKGIPEWIADDKDVSSGDLVVWHSFGVVHMPRPEDFPVMPVEHTGFSIKPDGFFANNPSNDLPPPGVGGSKCCM